MLSRKQILSLYGIISLKSPDHLFYLIFFDIVLHTIEFRASVLSFFIRVAEVPLKNSLLPAVLFFTDSATFCLSLLLKTLSKLKVFKSKERQNVAESVKNRTAGSKEFFRGTSATRIKKLKTDARNSIVWSTMSKKIRSER